MDAVIREHQRAAYGAFLSALDDYERAVHNTEDRAEEQLIAAGTPFTNEELTERTLELMAAISIDDILRTATLVELQGPVTVSDAADEAVVAFADHHYGARPNWRVQETVSQRAQRVFSGEAKLNRARRAFTTAARAELNHGSSRRQREQA
ncbi:hypothetical protein [Streptomyces sp. NPDC088707]|uniref:hypothetical protein n=1 Tax=Streptomyces sp. NPDC088707 TaxID=3365871 RepID=UPI0037FE63E7